MGLPRLRLQKLSVNGNGPLAPGDRVKAPDAFGRTVVLRYGYELEFRQLAPATINLRLAAVRRLAYEASDNGLSGIRRVKRAKRLGMRIGNSLTARHGRKLFEIRGPGSIRERPRYALASARLRFAACGTDRIDGGLPPAARRALVHYQPVRKVGHVRTVPVPSWVKAVLDQWLTAARIEEGVVFRRVSRTGTVCGPRISEKLVLWVIQERAKPQASRS
jgi:hypothetical protein